MKENVSFKVIISKISLHERIVYGNIFYLYIIIFYITISLNYIKIIQELYK